MLLWMVGHTRNEVNGWVSHNSFRFRDWDAFWIRNRRVGSGVLKWSNKGVLPVPTVV